MMGGIDKLYNEWERDPAAEQLKPKLSHLVIRVCEQLLDQDERGEVLDALDQIFTNTNENTEGS
jgi:hypothetical protein